MYSMLSYHTVQNVIVRENIGKISHPKILNVLKCIAEEILQRFIVMLSTFYTANILHYTAGILVNNVDELFRL